MMDMDHLKQELDVALSKAGDAVGVAFSPDLFEAFRQRGWISLETFGVLGTTLFQCKLPAYNKSHFAVESWDLTGLTYEVGRSDSFSKGRK